LQLDAGEHAGGVHQLHTTVMHHITETSYVEETFLPGRTVTTEEIETRLACLRNSVTGLLNTEINTPENPLSKEDKATKVERVEYKSTFICSSRDRQLSKISLEIPQPCITMVKLTATALIQLQCCA